MRIRDIISSIIYRVFKKDKRFIYYSFFMKNLELNRSEIVEKQTLSIKKLISHAYYNTDYYKEVFDNNNILPEDIKTKEDLNKIPELTKDLLSNNIEKIKSKDVFGQNLIRITTGGSSGIQTVLFYSKYYQEVSHGVWLRNNSIINWNPNDKVVWFWGSPIDHISPRNKLISKLASLINRRLIINTSNFSKNDLHNTFIKILKFKPKVIYGYASYILEFSQFLIDNNYLIPSVKIVVTTAEKLKNRNTIKKAFKCKVYDQYGCREIIAIGIEADEGEMYNTDDFVIQDKNINNELVLTSLYSYGFPLINYKPGDTGGEVFEKETTSLLPFPCMNLKIGRETDNFLKKNNVIVSSSALSTYLSTLDLKIIRHQIIQKSYNDFTVNYVSKTTTSISNYTEIMTRTLKLYFNEDIDITFQQVSSIKHEDSGKLLMFKRTFNL